MRFGLLHLERVARTSSCRKNDAVGRADVEFIAFAARVREAGHRAAKVLRPQHGSVVCGERVNVAIVGTGEECVRKIEQAAEAGARQFCMHVGFPDKAGFVRDWAREVMPAFRP